jgi:hypothetical protein
MAEAQSTMRPAVTAKRQPTTSLAEITPVLRPLLNIARTQYEEAHNRWLSKRIDTYQISVHEVSMRVCSTDAIVSNGGNNPQAIGEYAFLGPCATVEGLFEMVDRRLKAIEPPISDEALWTSWYVSFDEELGYPNMVSTQVQPGVQVTDQNGGIEVTSLKILKYHP